MLCLRKNAVNGWKVIAKEKDRLDGEVIFSNCIVCIYL